MSELARDILCVPVSIVVSESVFRLGGGILDQFHSSLSSQIVKFWFASRTGCLKIKVKVHKVFSYIFYCSSFVTHTFSSSL